MHINRLAELFVGYEPVNTGRTRDGSQPDGIADFTDVVRSLGILTQRRTGPLVLVSRVVEVNLDVCSQFSLTSRTVCV